jgi:hypothetical protein
MIRLGVWSMYFATGQEPEHVPHWMQVSSGFPSAACRRLATSVLKVGLVAI